MNGKPKNNKTTEQQTEFMLATWFSNIKRAKLGMGNTKLYQCIEKRLNDTFGDRWYDCKSI